VCHRINQPGEVKVHNSNPGLSLGASLSVHLSSVFVAETVALVCVKTPQQEPLRRQGKRVRGCVILYLNQ